MISLLLSVPSCDKSLPTHPHRAHICIVSHIMTIAIMQFTESFTPEVFLGQTCNFNVFFKLSDSSHDLQ
jgi:hypothetical protein